MTISYFLPSQSVSQSVSEGWDWASNGFMTAADGEKLACSELSHTDVTHPRGRPRQAAAYIQCAHAAVEKFKGTNYRALLPQYLAIMLLQQLSIPL